MGHWAVYRVDLEVRPRPGVKDPQAEAVQESLTRLGHGAVTVDAVGRLLALTIDCADADEARRIAEDLCEELLVNPNLETFTLRVAAET
jgi:phosphoribosylformylglycinamidine synthase subunit PurS